MLPLFYHEIYTSAISPHARFPRDRYRLVYEEIQSRTIENPDLHIELRESFEAHRSDILLVHSEGYTDAFLDGKLTDQEIRRIGFRPWTPEFVERTLTITGGSIQAMRTALEGSMVAGNLAGGTHHAFADHGEGFCVFNDLAICARIAQRDYGIKKIAIIDCDVHQGNGTASIFADDRDILTFSIHGEKNYPFRKEKSDFDIELPNDTDDDTYFAALKKTLPQALYSFQPELIFYQAGCDPLKEDTLGKLALSRQGLDKRNQLVFQHVSYWNCPLVVFMGGGYADPIQASVICHADVFEEAAALKATVSSTY
ncbi:MAG: histone deacetylase [Leptospiraceae bacterium]|nr:histone deacetylase [Leptospiraceae bacterium]